MPNYKYQPAFWFLFLDHLASGNVPRTDWYLRSFDSPVRCSGVEIAFTRNQGIYAPEPRVASKPENTPTRHIPFFHCCQLIPEVYQFVCHAAPAKANKNPVQGVPVRASDHAFQHPQEGVFVSGGKV